MTKEKLYNISLLIVFFAGVVLRGILYFSNQSLWGDEASLAANILNDSYGELLRGLKHLQAAPVAFTIIVKSLIDLFNPQTFFVRDLVLRFIPFLSGVLVLPAFYYLSKLVFENNKKLILISTALLSLNPCAVVYSAQLKQYSTEMLLTVILLIIFYRILVDNKFKWSYSFIVALAPWFSYSSFFVIAGGYFALLVKNWKKAFLFVLPASLSILIYYLVSLKFVFAANYSGMDEYWTNAYAFLDLLHPMRFLFRLGEVFAMTKSIALISGLIVFMAYLKSLLNSEPICKKILFVSPIFFVIFASMLHKYPFCARLILFLVPFFVILITNLRNKFTFSIISVITIFSLFGFTPDAQEVCYSYARQTALYLEKNLKPEDKIIIDANFADYDVYLKPFSNEIIRLPIVCIKRDIPACHALIKELPAGEYYFLSSSYYVKEVLEGNNVEVKDLDLGFKPKKTKSVYFIKG